MNSLYKIFLDHMLDILDLKIKIFLLLFVSNSDFHIMQEPLVNCNIQI
jgi:hypothetical protein